MPTIRPAQPPDIPSQNAITTHYIQHTVSTFQLTPLSDAEALANLHATRSKGLPFLVAVDSGENSIDDNSSEKNSPDDKSTETQDKIVGYALATPFNPARAAYADTVSLSLFCHPDHLHQGVGTALLARLLDVLRRPEGWGGEWGGWERAERVEDDEEGERKGERLREVIVCMALDERGRDGGWGLVRWYEGFGFRQVGRFRRVGRKFGRL